MKYRYEITTMGVGMREKTLLRRVCAIVAAAVVLAVCLSPDAACGSEPSDVEYPDELLLGVFTQSRLDSTDMLYVSRDGVHMEFAGSAFRDSTPEYDSVDESGRESVDGQFTLVNPSIIWHGGRFWDLRNWTKQTIIRVPVEGELPPSNGKDFDAVAADWAEDPVSHKVYAVVSLGHYGAFHGKKGDDMRPYLIPFASLQVNNVVPSKAVRIHLPYKDDHDRIDGSLYFENGKTFYSVKRDGVNNA